MTNLYVLYHFPTNMYNRTFNRVAAYWNSSILLLLIKPVPTSFLHLDVPDLPVQEETQMSLQQIPFSPLPASWHGGCSLRCDSTGPLMAAQIIYGIY